MKDIQSLFDLIRAGYAVIYCVLWGEVRFRLMLKSLTSRKISNPREIYYWSIVKGFWKYDENDEEEEVENATDPVSALEWVNENARANRSAKLFVLHDFHHHIEDPVVQRMLRELSAILPATGANLIITAPELKIPSDLDKTITVYDFPLPDEEEMGRWVIATQNHFRKEEAIADLDVLGNGDLMRITRALLGMTREEAENVLAKSAARHGRFLLEEINEDKKVILRKLGVEYYDSDETANSFGGAGDLKAYIEEVAKIYGSRKAEEFGCSSPKGVMLFGPPGTGKTLCAKVIANVLGTPLVVQNLNELLGQYVGESEAKVKKFLRVIDSMDRVTMLWDEFEKVFGGAGDTSGVRQSIQGIILTWMQERKGKAFIVATANDPSMLPAALLRDGRFDSKWVVTLPDFEDRIEIAGIHLAKRNRTPDDFNLEAIAKVSAGFSGAEVEQAVLSGLRSAFVEGVELSTRHIVVACKNATPLSKTMKEQIDALLKWAVSDNRARLAKGTKPRSTLGLGSKRTIQT